MSTSASTSTSANNPSTLTSPTSASQPSTIPSPTTSQSPESLRQTAEARRALEASLNSIGTSLSTQLQSRAQNLHANTKVLSKQETDVAKATANLKKENEKLRKVVDEGSRTVKELGNVQNWAEMLERDFLVLQETVRLANGGSESGSDGSWTGSEVSWSGSESGDERDGVVGEGEGVGKAREDQQSGMAIDQDGDTTMDDATPPVIDVKGKGKQILLDQHDADTSDGLASVSSKTALTPNNDTTPESLVQR